MQKTPNIQSSATFFTTLPLFSLAVLYINFHFNLENLKKEEGKNANKHHYYIKI